MTSRDPSAFLAVEPCHGKLPACGQSQVLLPKEDHKRKGQQRGRKDEDRRQHNELVYEFKQGVMCFSPYYLNWYLDVYRHLFLTCGLKSLGCSCESVGCGF